MHRQRAMADGANPVGGLALARGARGLGLPAIGGEHGRQGRAVPGPAEQQLVDQRFAFLAGPAGPAGAAEYDLPLSERRIAVRTIQRSFQRILISLGGGGNSSSAASLPVAAKQARNPVAFFGKSTGSF